MNRTSLHETAVSSTIFLFNEYFLIAIFNNNNNNSPEKNVDGHERGKGGSHIIAVLLLYKYFFPSLLCTTARSMASLLCFYVVLCLALSVHLSQGITVSISGGQKRHHTIVFLR